MWYLKTRLGVFWVVPLSPEKSRQFLLGVNDEELGLYTNSDEAARDVHDQTTGFLKWDMQPKTKAPEHITAWVEGEPPNWAKN